MPLKRFIRRTSTLSRKTQQRFAPFSISSPRVIGTALSFEVSSLKVAQQQQSIWFELNLIHNPIKCKQMKRKEELYLRTSKITRKWRLPVPASNYNDCNECLKWNHTSVTTNTNRVAACRLPNNVPYYTVLYSYRKSFQAQAHNFRFHWPHFWCPNRFRRATDK